MHENLAFAEVLPSFAPAASGGLQVQIEVRDGVIAHAKPILGHMHRSAEWLFTQRDYRAVLPIANRHNWLASAAGEIAVAELVEEACGIPCSPEVRFLRILLQEAQRAASHALFLSAVPGNPMVAEFRQVHAELTDALQQLTGNRVHLAYARFGGVAIPPTVAWLSQFANLCAKLRDQSATFAAEFHNWFGHDGLAPITLAEVTKYGLTGQVARASGWPIDLRSAIAEYEALGFSPVTENAGDARARFLVLTRELESALQLANQAIEFILPGDKWTTVLPKSLRVPEGAFVHSLETPLGVSTWLLISDGGKRPLRLKLQPASLPTALALESALTQVAIEDLAIALASMPILAGDTDR